MQSTLMEVSSEVQTSGERSIVKIDQPVLHQEAHVEPQEEIKLVESRGFFEHCIS